MNSKHFSALVFIMSLVAPAVAAQQTNYLFAYFKNNGEDGLHLAYSHDGLKWKALNEDKSYLTPAAGGEKLMRDPCVIQGPDGVFHMVWTVGWRGREIGVASSRDLIRWSEQQAVPVMAGEPAAMNCWAPEIFYDDQKKQYLIFWATTIPGRFPATDSSGDNGLNHRIYYVTTKDFRSYSKAALLYDGGFNAIDATIIKSAGQYVMILKDETRNPVKKNLRIAVSRNATGPYGAASPPFSPDWVEGPTAARVNNEWVVYFDMYRDHRYGAVKSADLKNWETVTDKLSMPAGARHGSIFTVPDEVLARLLVSWDDCLDQKPEWYAGDEAKRIADNVLLYQRESGGWPKNINMAVVMSEQAKAGIAKEKSLDDSLIDNGATYTQMAYLARVFNASRRPDYKESFIKGVDYLLKAQYENGGWPQYYPRLKGYYKHITFNDDAMVGVMELLRKVARKDAAYSFVDEARRARAESAVARGTEVILKTQIVVNGKRTAWCAQHDEVTLAPAPARSYEHVSLSGLESVGVVRFLMGIDHPDERIIDAVESAVAWFKESKISGIKLVEKPDPSFQRGFDRVIVEDPAAGPLWARFYEINTGRPIFSGRDSVIKYSLAEIEQERRTGYNWYTNAPAQLLEKDYPAWHAKWGKRSEGRNVSPRFFELGSGQVVEIAYTPFRVAEWQACENFPLVINMMNSYIARGWE
ncbi:MAG TPA: pectate lyase [Blastocatellia bacterium]|jgi:PelA/Pel-15E family pectate lyase